MGDNIDQVHELSVRALIAEFQLAMVERLTRVETKSDVVIDEVKTLRHEMNSRWTDVEARLRVVETRTDDWEDYEADVNKLKKLMQWVTAAVILFATAAPFVVQWIERSLQ
jgi:uncharacterized protein (UPF0335 family)